MNDENEPLQCDECGKEITGEYYYIGDNGAAMLTYKNAFCSKECVLEYLMVDTDRVGSLSSDY